MQHHRKNESIAAGSHCRSFDGARKAKSLLGAALSIITLAAPLTLRAQSVSYAGAQTTVPAQGLGKTSSVAIDGSDNLYILDTGNNRIVEITPSGAQTTVPVSGLNNATQLAADSAGDLFVANGNQLLYYSPASQQTTNLLANYIPQTVQSVSVDSSGYLYATVLANGEVNGGVLEFNPGLSEDALVVNLDSPYGAAVTQGYMYIVEPQSESEAVSVPQSGYILGNLIDYNESAIAPMPIYSLKQATVVVADQAGDAFIADTGNNLVKMLPYQGPGQLGDGPTFGSPVTLAAGGLSNPTGLALDKAGNLYIADQNNNRVVELVKAYVPFGAVNVCASGQTSPAPCSKTIPVTFNVTASGTLGGPMIYAPGEMSSTAARNADFILASGSTCTGAVTAGSTCTVNVTFNPKYPGLRTSSVWLTDSHGDILATLPMYGIGQAPQVAFSQASQSTVRTIANPTSAVVDAGGNLFVAQQNGEVWKFFNGTQSLLASGLGSGLSLAVDGADTAYITDPVSNQVLKVPAKSAQSTVGSGLNRPNGVAVDGEGNVFIADSGNNRVVEVRADGSQFTIGTGLNNPIGVATDGLGDVYIADTDNQRVVEVSASGTQTTIGTGLLAPTNLAVDAAGDVYIVDQGLEEVVEVTPSGSQTTLGTGLVMPFSVALDGAADVFITDWQNNKVVEVQQSQPQTLSFASTAVGSASAPQSVTVQNIGNQPLNATGLSVGSNFKQEPGSGSPADCTSNVSLADGASCDLSIIFTPYSTGSIGSSAVLTDNSLNSTSATQSIKLTGTGTN